MNAKTIAFVHDAKANGKNTRIDYTASHGGQTVRGTVIASGTFSEQDIEVLRGSLEGGTGFSARTLGFPDLTSQLPGNFDESKIIHHISRVVATNAPFDHDVPDTDGIIALLDSDDNAHSWSTEAPRAAV